MTTELLRDAADGDRAPRPTRQAHKLFRRPILIAVLLIGLVGIPLGVAAWNRLTESAAPKPQPLPTVTVSTPLVKDLAVNATFLGQFSAVESVEIRAQVGGTLTGIHFRDGQIVKQGEELFTIDPRPFEIRLAQAAAQIQSAKARLVLAGRELQRAQDLKRSDFATPQTVDQRTADQQAAQAALDQANAAERDAELDLEYAHVKAPFTGRVSSHRVSVGNLISGSRAATSPTTLLTTIVSLDPIRLDFDMSEADYLAYKRGVKSPNDDPRGDVEVSLSDETNFGHPGHLEFVDNALDRGSGTIHARALIANHDYLIAPGAFGRLRLSFGKPAPTMLVPDAAITLDQSNSVVMTVSADNTVVPKVVEAGPLFGRMRAVRSGLEARDRVVVDGLSFIRPGAKVVADMKKASVAGSD